MHTSQAGGPVAEEPNCILALYCACTTAAAHANLHIAAVLHKGVTSQIGVSGMGRPKGADGHSFLAEVQARRGESGTRHVWVPKQTPSAPDPQAKQVQSQRNISRRVTQHVGSLCQRQRLQHGVQGCKCVLQGLVSLAGVLLADCVVKVIHLNGTRKRSACPLLITKTFRL